MAGIELLGQMNESAVWCSKKIEFLKFKKTLIFRYSKNLLVNFCILNEDFLIPKIAFS